MSAVDWFSGRWGDATHHDVIHRAQNGSYDGTLERDKGEGRSDDE